MTLLHYRYQLTFNLCYFKEIIAANSKILVSAVLLYSSVLPTPFGCLCPSFCEWLYICVFTSDVLRNL
jgi:hypothetical protein